MAKMSSAAMVLLLGAAMVVQSSAKAVDCVSFCAGNDVAARKKGSSSSKTPTTPLMKPNTPDKCGVYRTGGTPTTCDCGDCTQQYTTRACILNKPTSLTDSSGLCCSCSDTVSRFCFCGGTDPKTATFCSGASQDTGNTCLSCKLAVCCETASLNGLPVPASVRYSGFASPVALAGQIDWTASASATVAGGQTAACATGTYSCAGLTATQCINLGYP